MVVAHAVGERLIWVVVGLIGIPVGAAQPLDQVGDRRRDLGRVDRLEPLPVDQARGHVVGHDHQVPTRVEAGIELGLDGGQEVFVAVDVLDVVDLDARLGLEVGQCRRRGAVRVPVHVSRPVSPVQRAGDRLAGCRGVGRARAAARARAATGARAFARARAAATGDEEGAGAGHGRHLEHRAAADLSIDQPGLSLVLHGGASKLRRGRGL